MSAKTVADRQRILRTYVSRRRSKLSFLLILQIIFPEWRDIPQPLNDGGEMFDDIVHLFFGIIDGEAEADRSM
ncbi:MAG: hypothetical protein A2026_14800 [Deltaproteobacteria bacterium RBG_19FT_COMBO_46_12]|nr:MAG: hypothetical protein A2026_14800 [Deltaproteobacteria bacterium RBG_19FT_COMBO_46_12]